MTRLPLIIDCDPGVDDAVGLLLALGSEALEVLAITTVGGNVPLWRTARNARMVRQVAGRDEVPVFAGAERPLARVLDHEAATDFHGIEGLGDIPPFEPDGPLADGSAAEAVVRLVMERPAGSVALAVMGPMTNLALALRIEPRLAAHLGTVVVMGGARSEGGNVTASAEFNIWADPEAAAEVLESGCDIVMIGLDATHQVRATETRIAAVEAVDTAQARMAASVMRFSQGVERTINRLDDPPLHDPCTVAWLLKPDLFDLTPCLIRVETGSDLTRGHTSVEFRPEVAGGPLRHRWATGVRDPQGVFDLITEALT